jgi:hypothetical protein
MMKIIFLDIDGVLQPGTQHRFDYDLDQLKDNFVKKDPDYGTLDKYDIGATYYDWDKNAISLLKTLCDKTDAKFVISSDWRTHSSLKKLQLLFSIHNLDGYVFDTLETEFTELRRYQEIQNYLSSHENISHFVIIDDSYARDFNEHFPLNFVQTEWVLTAEDYEKSLKILEK